MVIVMTKYDIKKFIKIIQGAQLSFPSKYSCNELETAKRFAVECMQNAPTICDLHCCAECPQHGLECNGEDDNL